MVVGMKHTEIKTASEMGKAAKLNGTTRAPSADVAFSAWNDARKAPIGHPMNKKILKAWLNGWDAANIS